MKYVYHYGALIPIENGYKIVSGLVQVSEKVFEIDGWNLVRSLVAGKNNVEADGVVIASFSFLHELTDEEA